MMRARFIYTRFHLALPEILTDYILSSFGADLLRTSETRTPHRLEERTGKRTIGSTNINFWTPVRHFSLEGQSRGEHTTVAFTNSRPQLIHLSEHLKLLRSDCVVGILHHVRSATAHVDRDLLRTRFH